MGGKTFQNSYIDMLLLKLLKKKDMYGYEIVEILSEQSNNIFKLKAGTLYPLLHLLEEQELIFSFEIEADSKRIRKYYRITSKGLDVLKEKKKQWNEYYTTINAIVEE